MTERAFLAHYCAHCRSADMSFLVTTSTKNPATTFLVDSFGICRRCQRATLFLLVPSPSTNHNGKKIQWPHEVSGDVLQYFDLITAMPAAEEAKAPEHTPKPVADAYVDALKSLNNSLWTPAGIMARKTIDVATKSLDPHTKKGSPLRDRIDNLRAKGLITEALQVMAHVVRLDGNDAVHEEDPFTEDEAQEICEFARLFLTLTFTVNGNATAAAAKHPQLVQRFQQGTRHAAGSAITP